MNGNKLSVTNIFSTKMYCHEVPPIKDEFFRQLQRVTGYGINEKKLILFNFDDAVLKFETR